MKKLLISLCAASCIAASAIGYAGNVILVNQYDKPVTFAVSKGSIYNPVVLTTLQAGERTTVWVKGVFTPDYHFMAYAPTHSMIVTNCGSPYEDMDNVMVKAGWSKVTGSFGCRIYTVPDYPPPVSHKTCPHKSK